MLQFAEQKEIIDEYNEVMKKSQNIAIFTRCIEIQKEEMNTLVSFDRSLEIRKAEYIKARNEKAANLLLCLQQGVNAVLCELSMLVALKEDEPGEAWNYLIEAQNLADNAIQNHPINGNSLLGYKRRLLAYETVLFPRMIFSSIGGIIMKSECSICKKAYADCDHLKGRFYMGEMCCRIITEIDLEEFSAVEHPADKRCRPINIGNEMGDRIDVLTLRKIESTTANSKVMQ